MTGFTSMAAAVVLGIALAAGAPPRRAMADPLTIFESATPFTGAGFRPLRLTGAALGSGAPYIYRNDTVSFAGLADDQGVVRGASPGNYAAPITDPAGDAFRGKYLSTGNTGYINIAFATPQQSLSLLWGSIDMSNEIAFLDAGQIVGVVDGGDVDPAATGVQGVGGSAYVLIDSAVAFDDIEISSLTPSFELAELKTSAADIPVHEPASIVVFGSSLLCLAGLRRRARPARPLQRGSGILGKTLAA